MQVFTLNDKKLFAFKIQIINNMQIGIKNI